ncbi:hypothetical protein DY000_02020269 [Brassica cretica]|uniref:Uncharacterized protein n=1 Tax=Brassica cretica TaxID=69181 RepID=A0ABQ7EJ84_BRACR|nr:hypothetical protein DY000_02020269 [Brassica cretica]
MREENIFSSKFVEADEQGQTDPVWADILWEAFSVSGLKVNRINLDFNGWIFCCLGFSEALSSQFFNSAVLNAW